MKKLLTLLTDTLLDLWVRIAGTPVVPNVGEIYALYNDSPFESDIHHRVEVTDTLDGWVQYKYVGKGDSLRSSMRISSFVMVYKLETPVRCDGGKNG